MADTNNSTVNRGGTQFVRRWLSVFQDVWVEQRSSIERTWDSFADGKIDGVGALTRELVGLTEQWMVNAQRLWSIPLNISGADANTVPTIVFLLKNATDTANPKTLFYVSAREPIVRFSPSIRIDNPGNLGEVAGVDPLAGRLFGELADGELQFSISGLPERSRHAPPQPGHYVSLARDENAQNRPIAIIHVVVQG